MKVNYTFWMRRLRAVIGLLRPANSLGAVLAFGIGYLASMRPLLWQQMVIGAVIILALHSMATLENDVQDEAIDLANGRTSALLDESLTRPQAHWIVYGLGAIALGLALRTGDRATHVVFVLALMVVTWTYNCRPFRLSRKPIASMVAMGLSYGALPLAYGYALAGGKSLVAPVLLSGIWFVQRVSISILKDFKDEAADRKFAKRTFYIAYGYRPVIWVSLVGGALAYLSLLACAWLLRPQTFLPYAISYTLTVVLVIRSILVRRVLRSTKNEGRLNMIFHRIVACDNQVAGAILLCLALSGR